jgi:hypothetical protein
MNNIQFSFVAPSIRPHLWKQFYNSVKDTKINWEVIFVGPLSPVEELPPNVRWIKASVKPSQCTHIGFLEAKGEIVSLTADDAQYFAPNGKSAIDNMYEFMNNFPEHGQYNNKRIAYGFRMFEDCFCVETSHTHYLDPSKRGILLYPFFAIFKDTYLEIEGYDNGFICGQAENDFLLRIAKKYGSTMGSLCPLAMVWANHNDHSNSGKFREYHTIENAYLKKLWLDDSYLGDEVLKKIREGHAYINDNTIYTVTQGEKGEWL